MRRALRILRNVVLLLIAAAIVLAAVLVANTWRKSSQQIAVTPVAPVAVDESSAAQRLGGVPLGDRLILQVEDGRDAPLAIKAVRLRLPQARLMVTDAGAGRGSVAVAAAPRRLRHQLRRLRERL